MSPVSTPSPNRISCFDVDVKVYDVYMMRKKKRKIYALKTTVKLNHYFVKLALDTVIKI